MMLFAYVGCYTDPDRGGHGQGIRVYQMNPETGTWTNGRLVAKTGNPSFLAVDPSQQHLYCVHGGGYEKVSSFAIDRSTGDLTFLNEQPSGGMNPVSLEVDPTGRMLVVANYSGGNTSSMPLNADGSLGEPPAVFGHIEMIKSELKDPANAVSQPHHFPFDPAGRFVVAPDKGLDRLFVYGIDLERGALIPNNPLTAPARAGAGPRHIAFHPSARFAYVINELDVTVGVYAYDAEKGTLKPIQVISSLPDDATGESTGGEIAVGPTGEYVYASNRGHDTIAIFRIDQENGTITPVDWTPTEGRTPRFFTFDRSGRFMYVANQDSDNIVPFRVDSNDGSMTRIGEIIETGSPVTIVFVEA